MYTLIPLMKYLVLIMGIGSMHITIVTFLTLKTAEADYTIITLCNRGPILRMNISSSYFNHSNEVIILPI